MSLIWLTIATIAATCVSAWLDHQGRVENAKQIKAIREYVRKRIEASP